MVPILARLIKSAGAAMALCCGTAVPVCAQELETPTEQDDLARPVANLDIRYRFEDQTTRSQDDQHELIFRTNWRIDLPGPWRMGLRFDVPVRADNKIDAGNPGGEYQVGMARFLAQAYLAEDLDSGWAYGFGARLTAPAASGSAFGSGNWQIAPLVGARVVLPEISKGSFFEPILLYAQSFGQSFPSSRTSNLQAGPQLKIVLSDKWFVELYPTTDIRWNFSERTKGQTGRLFLPFDAAIGRHIGRALLASLEVSVPIVKDYPVYDLKIETRVAYQF